jgi:hypothetical protein
MVRCLQRICTAERGDISDFRRAAIRTDEISHRCGFWTISGQPTQKEQERTACLTVRVAQSPQAFNITNGDVFEWRNVWPGLAETLGVETGPDLPTSVAAYLEESSDVWDRIVAKYDLRSRNPGNW